jgi:septation ring formation regulator EzrA
MEAGILRKQVHTLQSQIEALMAHQGFSYKEKTEKVPFTFSVPESEKITDFTLEKFVKESEQEVPVIKFTGDTTYQEDSMVLRKLWGVIKAVFWRNIAKDAASVAGEISKLIKNQNNTIDKITDNSVDNLQRYLEDFENGFTNGYTGGTTTQGKPFGLDYTLGVLL